MNEVWFTNACGIMGRVRFTGSARGSDEITWTNDATTPITITGLTASFLDGDLIRSSEIEPTCVKPGNSLTIAPGWIKISCEGESNERIP